MVALGVVLLAVIVTIMAVNWAKLISDECHSESIVLIVLLIFIIVGLISVWMLLFLRIRCNRSVEIHTTEMAFLRIKLISMYIFGLGFLLHCGLYIWKHATPNNCEELDNLGISYNTLSIFFTHLAFLSILHCFMSEKKKVLV